MKKAIAILGHLVFVCAGAVALAYVLYIFVYHGKGSFTMGSRHAHFMGYFYPWRVFGLTTALVLPALAVNVLRLLQLCLPSNKVFGQSSVLRGISEYSILIILLSFLLMLPEIDLVNDRAEAVLWTPKRTKPHASPSRKSPAPIKKVLPWEKDFITAAEKAGKEKRPLFIMMTADWCGWCRKLEQDTFTDKRVKELLKPFVCVQVFENREIDKKYGTGGYPNLAFARPNGEKVYGIGGYKPPLPFIRGIVKAYEALEMKLPAPYDEARKHFFELNREKADALIKAGNVAALEKLLEPVNKDAYAERNYLIARFELPEGINKKTLDVFSGYSYKPIPESGVVLLNFRQGNTDSSFSLVHRGCEQIHYQANFSEKHLESKVFTVKKLEQADKKKQEGNSIVKQLQAIMKTADPQLRQADVTQLRKAASLQGTVNTMLGQVINKAFVNLYDWQTIKSGRNENFQIKDVAPGSFTICATARGYASKATIVTLESNGVHDLHLKMDPAETVHIRWTYQAEEGNPHFDSGNIINGEYIINIKDSRFSLRRGHPLGNWGSDIMFRKKDDGKLYFHLFDAGGNGNGVIKTDLKYHAINAADPEAHYNMRPAESIEARQNYLVRCCQGDHYAKLQILDVCLDK